MLRTLSGIAAAVAIGSTVTLGLVPGVYVMPTRTPPGAAAVLSCDFNAPGTATTASAATSSPRLTGRSSD
jgi:hypothetical protein